MIRVDDEVYEALTKRRLPEESYNDGLKRLLGLARKAHVAVDQALKDMGVEEMADDQPLLDLIDVIDRYIPPRWADGPERARQIIWVVVTFLKQTPSDWTIRDRYNSSLNSVATRLGVRSRTVRDKCVRQLYGDGPHTGVFLDALARIEKASLIRC